MPPKTRQSTRKKTPPKRVEKKDKDKEKKDANKGKKNDSKIPTLEKTKESFADKIDLYWEMLGKRRVKWPDYEITEEFVPVVYRVNQYCAGCGRIVQETLSNHLTSNCYRKDYSPEEKAAITLFSNRFRETGHEERLAQLKAEKLAQHAAKNGAPVPSISPSNNVQDDLIASPNQVDQDPGAALDDPGVDGFNANGVEPFVEAAGTIDNQSNNEERLRMELSEILLPRNYIDYCHEFESLEWVLNQFPKGEGIRFEDLEDCMNSKMNRSLSLGSLATINKLYPEAYEIFEENEEYVVYLNNAGTQAQRQQEFRFIMLQLAIEKYTKAVPNVIDQPIQMDIWNSLIVDNGHEELESEKVDDSQTLHTDPVAPHENLENFDDPAPFGQFLSPSSINNYNKASQDIFLNSEERNGLEVDVVQESQAGVAFSASVSGFFEPIDSQIVNPTGAEQSDLQHQSVPSQAAAVSMKGLEDVGDASITIPETLDTHYRINQSRNADVAMQGFNDVDDLSNDIPILDAKTIQQDPFQEQERDIDHSETAEEIRLENEEIEDEIDGSVLLDAGINANVVPLNLQIVDPLCIGYSGGTEVHAIFLVDSNVTNMFDKSKEERLNRYSIRRRYADKNLPIVRLNLNIKLNIKKQPLLQMFYKFVHGRKSILNSTARLYTGYMARISIIILRSRGRIGAILLVDDILFAAQAIIVFFEQLHSYGVTAFVQHQFLAALNKFLIFLSLRLNIVNRQGLRSEALNQLRENVANISIDINETERDEKYYKKHPEVPPYCIPVTLVRNDSVIHRIEDIQKTFEQTRIMTTSDYFFYQGHMFASFIHLNASRTECVYKLMMKDLDKYHFKKYRIKVRPGVFETFWVLRFKPPKNLRAKKDRDGQFTGYIVLDEMLKRQLDFYLILRKRLGFSMHPNSPVFLQEDGKQMTASTLFIKSFLRQIGQGEYRLSCNSTRIAAAKKDFNMFCTNLIEAALRKRKLYILSGHKMDTRAQHYIRNISMAAIAGFIQLRIIHQVTRKDNLTAVAKLEEDIRKYLSNETDDSENDTIMETINEVVASICHSQSPSQSNKRMATSTDNTPAKRMRLDNNSSVNTAPEMVDITEQEIKEVKLVEFQNDSSNNSQILTALITQSSSQPVEAKKDSDANYIFNALVKHNARICTSFAKEKVKAVTDPEGAIKFLTRSANKPVQDFPWIQIADVPGVGWGAYAKRDLPGDVDISDYLGDVRVEEEHREWLESDYLSEQQKNTVCDYRVGIPHDGKVFYFTSHNDIYRGTIGLARLFNHTPHRDCINVDGRPTILQIGNIKYLKIVFRTTKKIKKGTQLLWHYGGDYNVYPWYDNCPSQICRHKDPLPVIPRLTFTRREPISLPIQHGDSSSQFDVKGTPLDQSEKPFDSLKVAASRINLHVTDFIAVGSSRDLSKVLEQYHGEELSHNVVELLGNQRDKWSLNLLIDTLSKIYKSFIVLTNEHARSRNVKCIRIGDPVPEVIIMWYQRDSSFVPIITDKNTVGNNVGERLSSTPTLILQNVSPEKQQHDFTEFV